MLKINWKASAISMLALGVMCVGVPPKIHTYEVVRKTYRSEASDAGFVDENFYNCVKTDDEFSNGLSNITTLSCKNDGITDTTGLEKLTGLTNLNISSNAGLTTIDVSKNIQLQYLTLADTGITTLDVSKNTELLNLIVNGENIWNTAGLSGTLDVSNNKKLIFLDLSYNHLTDVKNIPSTMRILNLGHNELTILDAKSLKKLTSLEVQYNKLTYLDCQELNKLSRLEVAGNLDIEYINASNTSISYLTLSGFTKLKKLYLANTKNISTLELQNLTGLEELNIALSGINDFGLNYNTNLTHLAISADKAKYIDFTKLTKLEEVKSYFQIEVTASGTTIKTNELINYIPSYISATDYEIYTSWDSRTSSTMSSRLYSDSVITGQAGDTQYFLVDFDGSNTDINGFTGKQTITGRYAITFTKDETTASSTTDENNITNPHTGVFEISIVATIGIILISALALIRTKKINLFKKL